MKIKNTFYTRRKRSWIDHNYAHNCICCANTSISNTRSIINLFSCFFVVKQTKQIKNIVMNSTNCDIFSTQDFKPHYFSTSAWCIKSVCRISLNGFCEKINHKGRRYAHWMSQTCFSFFKLPPGFYPPNMQAK